MSRIVLPTASAPQSNAKSCRCDPGASPRRKPSTSLPNNGGRPDWALDPRNQASTSQPSAVASAWRQVQALVARREEVAHSPGHDADHEQHDCRGPLGLVSQCGHDYGLKLAGLCVRPTGVTLGVEFDVLAKAAARLSRLRHHKADADQLTDQRDDEADGRGNDHAPERYRRLCGIDAANGTFWWTLPARCGRHDEVVAPSRREPAAPRTEGFVTRQHLSPALRSLDGFGGVVARDLSPERDGISGPQDATIKKVLTYSRAQSVRQSKIPKHPPRLWLNFMADARRRSRFLATYENRGRSSRSGPTASASLTSPSQTCWHRCRTDSSSSGPATRSRRDGC